MGIISTDSRYMNMKTTNMCRSADGTIAKILASKFLVVMKTMRHYRESIFGGGHY